MANTFECVSGWIQIITIIAFLEIAFTHFFSPTVGSCVCAYSYAFMCWSCITRLKEQSYKGYVLSGCCIVFLPCAEFVSYLVTGSETTYFWLKLCYATLFAPMWFASHGI